jgi:hypothetical protein
LKNNQNLVSNFEKVSKTLSTLFLTEYKKKSQTRADTSKIIKNGLSVGQNHVRLERNFADAMRAAFSSDAAHSKAADRLITTSPSYLPRARHSQNKIQRRGTPAQMMCVDPEYFEIHHLNHLRRREAHKRR